MPFKMSKTEKILTAIVGLALLGIGGLTIYDSGSDLRFLG